MDAVGVEPAGLQQAIEAMAKQDVRAKRIERIPGLAAYSPMLMVGEIGEIARNHSQTSLDKCVTLHRRDAISETDCLPPGKLL